MENTRCLGFSSESQKIDFGVLLLTSYSTMTTIRGSGSPDLLATRSRSQGTWHASTYSKLLSGLSRQAKNTRGVLFRIHLSQPEMSEHRPIYLSQVAVHSGQDRSKPPTAPVALSRRRSTPLFELGRQPVEQRAGCDDNCDVMIEVSMAGMTHP